LEPTLAQGALTVNVYTCVELEVLIRKSRPHVVVLTDVMNSELWLHVLIHATVGATISTSAIIQDKD